MLTWPVVAALALGNTIGQTVVAIPLVRATRRIRGKAAVQGVGHAALAVLAAGGAAVAFGVVAYILNGGDLRPIRPRPRQAAGLRPAIPGGHCWWRRQPGSVSRPDEQCYPCPLGRPVALGDITPLAACRLSSADLTRTVVDRVISPFFELRLRRTASRGLDLDSSRCAVQLTTVFPSWAFEDHLNGGKW